MLLIYEEMIPNLIDIDICFVAQLKVLLEVVLTMEMAVLVSMKMKRLLTMQVYYILTVKQATLIQALNRHLHK